MIPSDLMPFWLTLGRPLTRLLFAMCIGLLIANIVEALRWTQPLARLSAPLVRLARLREAAGASFSMAFFSPAAANALLSDSHAKGEISLRELVLANLFNSLPAYMVHLPTMLFMLWPVLGAPALIYTGLTLAAAALRTLFTVGLGHFLLPPLHGENCIECRLPQEKVTLKSAALKAWKRFRRRLPKLVMFTIPVYVAMYLMQHYGLFRTAEAWLSDHTPWLGFIRPEALGIVLLSLAAEIGASLSAAGSALHMGGLTPPEVIIALLVGNIFCAHCGNRLTLTTSGRKKNRNIPMAKYIRYQCHYNVRHPGECDGQSGYSVPKVDSMVEQVVRMKLAEIAAAPEAEIIGR